MHRGKSRGHPGFGLVPTAELGLASPLRPLCNQEGTFWPGSPGGRAAAGRTASRGLARVAHLRAAGSGGEPGSAPQPMPLCLAAQRRAARSPEELSDGLWAPKTQRSACEDKIKACFSSENFTIRDSAG